jgi:predicted ribosome-associated RNA-binding protein Tma20
VVSSEVEVLEGTALFPPTGTVIVWTLVVETVLLTVTEVVITEGAVRTVVDPAEVMLKNC